MAMITKKEFTRCFSPFLSISNFGTSQYAHPKMHWNVSKSKTSGDFAEKIDTRRRVVNLSCKMVSTSYFVSRIRSMRETTPVPALRLNYVKDFVLYSLKHLAMFY